MKTLYILAAAAAALTSTIGMAASGERSFVNGGETYVYTLSAPKDGLQKIDGHRLPSGDAFHLIVRNGRVSGVSNGVTVSFPVAQAIGAASGTQLASR